MQARRLQTLYRGRHYANGYELRDIAVACQIELTVFLDISEFDLTCPQSKIFQSVHSICTAAEHGIVTLMSILLSVAMRYLQSVESIGLYTCRLGYFEEQ